MAVRYTPLDHGGLEVAERPDAPEVLPGSFSPLDRKSSMLNPETVNAKLSEPKDGSFYSPSSHSDAPPPPTYLQPDHKEAGASEQDVGSGNSRRKYCGLRRGIFITILVVVILVVVLGAVLGGVLGTLLSKHKSSSPSQPVNSTSPVQTIPQTGMAAVLSAADNTTLLTYYQDTQNRIIENSYRNGTWSLSNTSLIEQSVVTLNAGAGSPLAAISYQLDGRTYRQVFFIAANGAIMTTNSSTTSDDLIATSWSPSIAITNDTAAASIVGLAACTSHDSMNGIRVYYPSQNQIIQEVGYTFGSSAWTPLEYWYQADVQSGIACAVYNGDGDQYINVYVRNSTTGEVQQLYYNYAQPNDGWFGNGPMSWPNQTIASGSDIAVCNDNLDTEYVFYQLQTDLITRGIVNPYGTNYETYNSMQGGRAGTKLAAAYLDGGALFMFQNASNASSMWVSDVSRQNTPVLNMGIL